MKNFSLSLSIFSGIWYQSFWQKLSSARESANISLNKRARERKSFSAHVNRRGKPERSSFEVSSVSRKRKNVRKPLPSSRVEIYFNSPLSRSSHPSFRPVKQNPGDATRERFNGRERTTNVKPAREHATSRKTKFTTVRRI